MTDLPWFQVIAKRAILFQADCRRSTRVEYGSLLAEFEFDRMIDTVRSLSLLKLPRERIRPVGGLTIEWTGLADLKQFSVVWLPPS